MSFWRLNFHMPTCLPLCVLSFLFAGALSLPEVQLAGPLAFGGLCLMAFSLLAFPRLQMHSAPYQ
jgi:hypothetical protein